MALTDNLISAWELSEASGNAIDSHGSNDLTDNGSVGTGTGLVYGTARHFDGSDDGFNIIDNTDLSVGDIDCSCEKFELLIKSDDSVTYRW